MSFFHNRSSYPTGKATPTGDDFAPKYRLTVDEDGAKKLIKDGEKPIYQMIQASAESADINVLVRRFINGDQSALKARPAFYVDASNMPKTLLDVYRMYDDAKAHFESLSLDVRKDFGNDFGKWLAAVDDGTYSEYMRKKTEASSIDNQAKQFEAGGNE